MVLLSYGLVINGLLGALGAGAHASEARTAAQLGIICTIHGIAAGERSNDDPTPGKLACIEHCLLAVAMAGPAPVPPGVIAHVPYRADAMSFAVFAAHAIAQPTTQLPPPRGPPCLI